ncbi:hypothetical protein [Streptomyces sp. NPDC058953]|uniref:hypothetical protein n=1 Tax=unclassified Streptomyces TaxID=2593676 RepID=UPI0036AA8FDC
MTRDGLLARPPQPNTAECTVCGRVTTVPVEVRPGRHTCPEHIVDALTSVLDQSADRDRGHMVPRQGEADADPA